MDDAQRKRAATLNLILCIVKLRRAKEANKRSWLARREKESVNLYLPAVRLESSGKLARSTCDGVVGRSLKAFLHLNITCMVPQAPSCPLCFL